jgi:FtsH-binding integral membrane protein
VNRVLLYLVLGVAGLGLAFIALVYLSIQVAKLFAVAAVLLLVVLAGRHFLRRDKSDRLGHGRPLSLEADDERQRIRHS